MSNSHACAAATLALSMVVTGCAPAPETAATPKAGSVLSSTIVDPYLRIASALANDSIEGVRANAGELATAATALGAPAMKIDTSAVQLAAAAEIEDARTTFGTLSDALVAYVDGLELTLPEGVGVAVCSMKQKPWLQRGAEIANPYFGSSMLGCGSFR